MPRSLNFTLVSPTPVFARGTSGQWDDSAIARVNVFYDTLRADPCWTMHYCGNGDGTDSGWKQGWAYMAPGPRTAPPSGPFVRDPANPVFPPITEDGGFNMNGSVLIWRGKYWSFYHDLFGSPPQVRAAYSTDRINWTRLGEVIPISGLSDVDGYGQHDPSGAWVIDDDNLGLLYGATNANGHTYRPICRATLTGGEGGLTCVKHGPIRPVAFDARLNHGEPTVLPIDDEWILVLWDEAAVDGVRRAGGGYYNLVTGEMRSRRSIIGPQNFGEGMIQDFDNKLVRGPGTKVWAFGAQSADPGAVSSMHSDQYLYEADLLVEGGI